MEKEIILIRHSSLAVPRGVCYGHSDIEVSDNFHKEASWLKDELEGYEPNIVLSSPLKRCKKLANFLFDQEIEYHDALKEINCGDWENLPWDIIGVEEKGLWMYKYPDVSTPNGESFEDLQKRVLTKLEELEKLDFQKAVVVCHGGVIRSVLSGKLGIPLSQTRSLHVHYAGFVRLGLSEEGWKLTELNSGY